MRDKEKVLAKVIQLKRFFDEGKIPTLEQHEVNPNLARSSRLHYIYFTLPVSINYQRSSPALWQSALRTYEDPDTNFVFYPEKVVETSAEDLQKALIKHKLALQQNRHTHIWVTISKTLFERYDSDPRLIFKETQNCVTRIKKLIMANKKDFPYIGGPKLLNYWLFILDHYTDIKLRNKHMISIIPDTHIKQSTEKLGITSSKKTENVEKAWVELLKGSDLTPVDLHSVLWNWSRNDFKPEV